MEVVPDVIRTPRRSRSREVGSRIGLTLVMALLGAIAGSLLGLVLQTWIPVASSPIANLGLSQPLTLDLKVFSLTFGATIRVNAAGILGMLVGGWYGFRQ